MSPDRTVTPLLRPAVEADAELLWRWVNDAAVRAASFRQERIGWEEHRAWFTARLESPRCRIYVAECDGVPVAQVRFDLDESGEAEIDVSVEPAIRGRGIGHAAVPGACVRLFAETGARSVVARVKPENEASLRMFARAAFADCGDEGTLCRRLCLEHPAAGHRYVVAAQRSWNRSVFERRLRTLPGAWTYIAEPAELTADRLAELDPRFVFFLHWSSIVPPEVTGGFTCIGFHMTDLPYGRGGSPLQNLIVRGHTRTKLSAFALEQGLDTGPIYAKTELELDGTAEEIYVRASERASDLIRQIIAEEPAPVPQTGEPVTFRRRTPAESELPELESAKALYDFVRMLDADGYPRAFLVRDGFRFELSAPELVDGAVQAKVSISPATPMSGVGSTEPPSRAASCRRAYLRTEAPARPAPERDGSG
jgi:methionyl-tRNA formyltransferase